MNRTKQFRKILVGIKEKERHFFRVSNLVFMKELYHFGEQQFRDHLNFQTLILFFYGKCNFCGQLSFELTNIDRNGPTNPALASNEQII